MVCIRACTVCSGHVYIVELSSIKQSLSGLSTLHFDTQHLVENHFTLVVVESVCVLI